MIKEIHHLYRKYEQELKLVRETQKGRVALLNPHFDDIESELLYLFLRDRKPSHVIEFSPYYGWSTSWILEALNKNGRGRCVSYDLHDESLQRLSTTSLDLSRWSLVQGNVEESYSKFDYTAIDFIFIDSNHSTEFAEKYVREVLYPAKASCGLQNKQIPVFIHDIFGSFQSSADEGCVVKEFLDKNNIDFVTPSKLEKFRPEIDMLRSQLNLTERLHPSSDVNPVVIFEVK